MRLGEVEIPPVGLRFQVSNNDGLDALFLRQQAREPWPEYGKMSVCVVPVTVSQEAGEHG